MFLSVRLIAVFYFIFTGVLASAYRNIYARASTNFNPDDVRDTKCDNPEAEIDTHDKNVALLQICGGIAGEIQKCQGNPTSTEGKSGTAKFVLNPVEPGATINVSKGRWERCIRAAQAKCPKGEYSSICKLGTSKGDLGFSLKAN